MDIKHMHHFYKSTKIHELLLFHKAMGLLDIWRELEFQEVDLWFDVLII